MPDPMTVAIAAAVAGKVTEALTASGKTGLAALVKLVRERFSRDRKANETLATADQAPDQPDRIQQLAAELERLTSQDPSFAERLRQHWSRAEPELRAAHGGVVNQITGNVSGQVIQARDISGGVHFGRPS